MSTAVKVNPQRSNSNFTHQTDVNSLKKPVEVLWILWLYYFRVLFELEAQNKGALKLNLKHTEHIDSVYLLYSDQSQRNKAETVRHTHVSRVVSISEHWAVQSQVSRKLSALLHLLPGSANIPRLYTSSLVFIFSEYFKWHEPNEEKHLNVASADLCLIYFVLYCLYVCFPKCNEMIWLQAK